LADPDCRIAIVEAGGGPAGQLRLERGPEGWEVDIFVLPEKRRGGVALAALAAGLAALRRDVGSAPAVARVRHANAASRALFERAGFRRAGGDDRAAIYRHDG
jgi:RimJ/RimL family protein N-acetyltransferase